MVKEKTIGGLLVGAIITFLIWISWTLTSIGFILEIDREPMLVIPLVFGVIVLTLLSTKVIKSSDFLKSLGYSLIITPIVLFVILTIGKFIVSGNF